MRLKEQFAQGETPESKELRGYYDVSLVTGLLPEIRFFGHRKFFPDDVDQENESPGGYNEFLGFIRIGSFKISVMDSILGDGQKVLHINYNRKGNSYLVRPLNDELKRVRDGYYLGRGIFDILGFKFNSFYFSVKRK